MTTVTRTPGWNRRLALIAIVVVAADWLTKFIVLNRVALYDRVALIGSWLSVVHVNNEGIAFSLFGDVDTAWHVPLLVVVIGAAVVVLIHMVTSLEDTTARISLALIVGGALGNLGDRLIDGSVTDFLQIRFFPYIFNIADIAVTLGGALLAVSLLKKQTPVIPSRP